MEQSLRAREPFMAPNFYRAFTKWRIAPHLSDEIKAFIVKGLTRFDILGNGPARKKARTQSGRHISLLLAAASIGVEGSAFSCEICGFPAVGSTLYKSTI